MQSHWASKRLQISSSKTLIPQRDICGYRVDATLMVLRLHFEFIPTSSCFRFAATRDITSNWLRPGLSCTFISIALSIAIRDIRAMSFGLTSASLRFKFYYTWTLGVKGEMKSLVMTFEPQRYSPTFVGRKARHEHKPRNCLTDSNVI